MNSLSALLSFLLLTTASVAAQTISVLVPFPDVLDGPVEPVADSAGNVYVVGSESDNLLRVGPDGTVTVVASVGMGLPAAFVRPTAVAVDSLDNVYVACGDSDNVFRFASGGGVSVVLDAAGGGPGNGLDNPQTLVVESADGVFVAGFDSDNVFHISALGSVTVVLDAGGLGPAAPLDEPRVALARGEVFVLGINEVFRVGAGFVVTEVIGPAGDGATTFDTALDIDVDTAGNVVVANGFNVFSITPGGTITPVLSFFISFGPVGLATDSFGSTWVSYSFITTPTVTEIPLSGAPINHAVSTSGVFQSIIADDAGNVYWVETMPVASNWLFKRAADGAVTVLIGQLGAGNGDWLLDGGVPLVTPDGTVHVVGRSSDNLIRVATDGAISLLLDGPEFSLVFPRGIHVDREGRVLVTGASSANVLRFEPGQQTAEELIDINGDGLGNIFTNPTGVATDTADNVWVSGFNSDNLFRISPAGVITEIIDFTGDGVHPFDQPFGVVVDTQDNVFVAGSGSDNVFKVTPGGSVTEIIDISGDGSGNDLFGPEAVAVDGAGNVYVAGRSSDNVFRIDPAGTVTKILDATGAGPGAELNEPRGLAVGWDGDVWVTGGITDNVLHLSPGGVVTQILDASGDGQGNLLDSPTDIVVDAFGTVYVIGEASDNVFRVDAAGTISVLLDAGGAGLGIPLELAQGLALDASGTLYVSDGDDNKVLAVTQDDWWTDLGGGAPGVAGRPELRIKGPLSAGSPMVRELTRVPPSAPMLVWISFASTPFDALGGTVYAFPHNLQLFFTADASGASSLTAPWPAGVPSGVDLTLQFIVQDLSVPAGITLSNAVMKTTP